MDEIVWLTEGEVVLHAPPDEVTVQFLRQAISGQGINLSDSFIKLVQAEEAELREPYAL